MSTLSRTVKPFYKSTTLNMAIIALIGAIWPVAVDWIETKEPPTVEEAMPVLVAFGAVGRIGLNRFRIDEDHPETPIGTPTWLPGRNLPTKFDLLFDQVQKVDEMVNASRAYSTTLQGGDLTSSVEQSDIENTPVQNDIVRAAGNNQLNIYRDVYTLQFNKKSFLKSSTEHSTPGDDSQSVDDSYTFDLLSWEPVDGDHLKVVLVDGERVKYVYAPDSIIYNNQGQIVHDAPLIEIEIIEDKGPKIKLSGIGEVHLNDPIIPNGNLTWAEMTKNGERLPLHTEESVDFRYTPSQQVQNMILVAEEFEKIRLLWGKPIIITSGLRPKAVNRAIKGATRSQHRTGLALDCVTDDIYRFEEFCRIHWPGRIGRAATGGRGFVHLDLKDRAIPYSGIDKEFSY